MASVIGGGPHREVDSSGWERRRGERPQGRMDAKKGKRSFADPGARTEKRMKASRASERP